MKHNDKTWS
jgi:hypothetical protein